VTQHELMIATSERGAVDITTQINALIKGVKTHLCHVFVAHTSASLMITGNEDANLLWMLRIILRIMCKMPIQIIVIIMKVILTCPAIFALY